MSTSFEAEGLVEYYAEFVPEHFIKPNGQPVGRRSAQIYAVKYNLPLVRVGLRTFIDVALAAQRLREAQLVRREPQRLGRPRKADAVPDRTIGPGPISSGRLRGDV